MKETTYRILENQLEIMDALNCLMMPEKPRKKRYLILGAQRGIQEAKRKTGKMLERENIKKLGKSAIDG